MRLISFLVGLAAIFGVLWWFGLPALAVLVTVVCGLAGLLYRIRGGSDGRTGNEQEGRERVLRDIPPPS